MRSTFPRPHILLASQFFRVIILGWILFFVVACRQAAVITLTKPTPSTPTVDITPTETSSTTPFTPGSLTPPPTNQTSTLEATNESESSNSQFNAAKLAYLSDKNIWLLDDPSAKPYPLTELGDLFSYAWSPDGNRIATYNGKNLCFINLDGNTAPPCIDLKLDEYQARIERHIVWSPDQKIIVLWNPVNPWDEGAIGWLVIALDGSDSIIRIEDPVSMGANMAPNNDPGGITGQPIFLPDGQLIGTLTHRWLCGSGGCHYQLYQFDIETQKFSPYPNKPEEGWSEGRTLVLSKDGRSLFNFGTFYTDCESYMTLVDNFELESQSRVVYNLSNEALNGLALSPDPLFAITARNAGCAAENPSDWATMCGLSQGFEIYNMQIWKLDDDSRTDLLPGITPDWSPDGSWIAFRSCLDPQPGGGWTTSSNSPPSIYLINPTGTGVAELSQGSMPTWRP